MQAITILEESNPFYSVFLTPFKIDCLPFFALLNVKRKGGKY